ncbi:PTS sugar transporter subunit IIA [Jeotgalibacillus terrae]|uniref:Ascorbate-specific PTS system EIIA component n=1 Tax=Jeotgalibacillus terrae TaxID=587735 RepID=A0ABW5ZLG1_9BACL|nr:PTS sugar transporter subunit IIA [Jeotgalibacillus terrae]MBM7579694.1 PTS system mannitol-specific IIA component/PTS system ascorbate-specific IIA component [Jeotgalibacillus terrae]
MLADLLKGNIHFANGMSTWEESIKVAAEPLLSKRFINESYVQDMIKNVEINGSYIVIAPGIAMPHAQNQGGVLKTGISFLKLENSVTYPEEKNVNILFVLAAEDSEGHLELISDLSSLLIDEDVMEQLKQSTDEEEVLNLIESLE